MTVRATGTGCDFSTEISCCICSQIGDQRRLPAGGCGVVEKALVPAPSPKKALATRSWPGCSASVLAAQAGGELRPDDAAAAEAALGVEQMHVAAFAVPEPGDLAEHFGGHLVERNAFGDREMVRAVRADHRVFDAKMGADAHSDGLLAGGEMHFAGHRARADVEGQTLLDFRRQFSPQR